MNRRQVSSLSGKVLVGCMGTFALLGAIGHDNYVKRAGKEPAQVATGQVQTVTTAQVITSTSIVAQSVAVSRGEVKRIDEDMANVKKIQRFLGGALKGQAENIVRYSKNYNINPRLVAAIISHETGNGTSYAVKVYKNVGGLMGANGLRKFATLEQSIEFMCGNLRTQYIDKGLNSIDLISGKYCPVGAENDPTNLNIHWLPRVTELYNQITNEVIN